MKQKIAEEKSALGRPSRVTQGSGLAASLPAGLLDACRNGERESVRVLFELYQDSVFSLALNFSGDRSLARDVCQNVFLKLISGLHALRSEENFRPWLCRLVVNACMDEHRRTRKLVASDEAKLYALDSATSPEDAAQRQQVGLEVRSAVTRLSPRLRLPILLRYVEGLSYEEIAGVLGCSMGTVASRLSRGHRALARRLSHLRGII